MILSRNKPVRLSLVWSREADPSSEFYQYAEPGRTLLARKSFAGADWKVTTGRGSRGTSSFPTTGLPRNFLSPNEQLALIGAGATAVAVLLAGWLLWVLLN